MLSSPHSNSPYRGKGMPPFTYSKHWNNVKEILEQSTGGIGMKNEGFSVILTYNCANMTC